MTLKLSRCFGVGCGMGPCGYLADDGLDLLLRNSSETIDYRSVVLKTENGRFHSNVTRTTVQDIRNFMPQLFFYMLRTCRTYISEWIGTGRCNWKWNCPQELIRQGMIWTP